MITARMAGRLCAVFMFFTGFALNCAPPRSVMLKNRTPADNYGADVRKGTPENIDFRWEDSDDEGSIFGEDDAEDEYLPESGRFTDNRLKNRMVRYDIPPHQQRAEYSEEDDEPGKISRVYDRKKPLKPVSEKRYKGGSYRVKRKDTLYGLSRKFGCTVDELMDANGLHRGQSLEAGMSIRIPRNAPPIAGIKPKRKPPTALPEGKTTFIWPVKNVLAVKRDAIDGVKPIGIKISGKSGAPVISSAGGVVKKIGEMRGYGKYIIIEHNDRFITVYAKVNDIRVEEGEKIMSGRVIAAMDKDEKAIHFQIGHEGKPVDPLRYLPGKS